VREELAPRADFLGIALLDLESKHCRFPKGEGAGILFCGQKVISGESWCVGCYPLVYLPPRPRAERGYHPTRQQQADGVLTWYAIHSSVAGIMIPKLALLRRADSERDTAYSIGGRTKLAQKKKVSLASVPTLERDESQ
jgi:hypothetical protein